MAADCEQVSHTAFDGSALRLLPPVLLQVLQGMHSTERRAKPAQRKDHPRQPGRHTKKKTLELGPSGCSRASARRQLQPTTVWEAFWDLVSQSISPAARPGLSSLQRGAYGPRAARRHVYQAGRPRAALPPLLPPARPTARLESSRHPAALLPALPPAPGHHRGLQVLQGANCAGALLQ